LKRFLLMLIIVFLATAFSSSSFAEEVYTTGQLLQEAAQNKPRFDKTYTGKVLNVDGFVGEIVEDPQTKGYRLRLQPEPGKGIWIGCLFDASQSDALADLDYKAPVRIKGMYKGKLPMQIETIVLQGCEIVK